MEVRVARFVHAVALAGCIHTLPPVAAPGSADPQPAPAPVPAGRGRIYVDVVDGPAEVRVVKPVTVDEHMGDLRYEAEELEVESVCTSPCVLDLPLGPHLLSFPMRGSGGTELDHVLASPSPSVYRRALGWRRSGGAGFALGVLGAAFGGSSFVTGAALLPVGLAKDSHGLTVAGEITLGAGALLTAVGIWAIMKSPITEQAGAGTQYELTRTDGAR